MAPAVRLREAVALAGRFPLLAGVTLDVGEGEIVHVRGPNGAGKTSLLRLCCGLLQVRSGEATVLGHDLVKDRRAVRGKVALLGHSAHLYEELTAAENVRFALRAAGADPGLGPPALERLGISGRLTELPVGRLSAGQRRRVALALLLARRPRLWLLDEPHAGLDPDGRELLDSLVAEARAGGATVLLSSHEHDRARALADRVVEIAGGRVTDGALTAPSETQPQQRRQRQQPEQPQQPSAPPIAQAEEPVATLDAGEAANVA
jgi:heme ABC exporter ATP-binding subunit CcmA